MFQRTLRFLLVALATTVASLSASADKVQVSGLYYNIDIANGTASVTSVPNGAEKYSGVYNNLQQGCPWRQGSYRGHYQGDKDRGCRKGVDAHPQILCKIRQKPPIKSRIN